MKRNLLALVILITITLTLSPTPTIDAQLNKSIGELALKVTGIPSGTPTGSQISWQFIGFTANATSTSTTASQTINQTLSASTNKTISADPITTPLSNLYSDDNTYYTVPALNETANFYWIARFQTNITISDHYIQKAWVKAIKIVVKGNSSITPDTRANIYLYNFTSSSWIDLGTALNTTTEATLTYNVPTDQIANIINSGNNITLEFYWYDSTNTAFTLTIDYLALEIQYQLNTTITQWTTTDQKISVAYAGGQVYNHTEAITTSLPVTNHNFTIYYKTDAYKLLTTLTPPTAKINNTETTVSTPITFSLTNNNANHKLTINFQLPMVYPIDLDGAQPLQITFEGGLNKLYMKLNATGTKTLQIAVATKPNAIYIDREPYRNWTYSNGILNITYTFNSPHEFEIYQYIPTTTTTTPTPKEETQPTLQIQMPETTLIYTLLLTIIGILLIILIINYYTCLFFRRLCRAK